MIKARRNQEEFPIEITDKEAERLVMKIEAYGLVTNVWCYCDDYGFGCEECCTGDRCDEDCKAPYKGRRKDCPHCKGRGWIPKSEAKLAENPGASEE